MELTNRSIEVTISKYKSDGTLAFTKTFVDKISVKFSFERYVGTELYGTGKVSICGLDKATNEELTTICSVEQALEERKTIIIRAGYGEQKALIIEGDITSAVPTVPPDVWIECEVLNGFERKQTIISVSLKGEFNVQEATEAIAKELNLRNGADCRIKNDSFGKRFYQRKMQNLSYKGSQEGIIQELMNFYSFEEGDIFNKVYAYIDNETLIVDYSNLDETEGNNRTHHIINKDTGMVGLPEISNAGTIANITTLLKPEIKAGDVIELESYMIPKANGQYNVIGITYTGDFRGNSWYSMFHCRRITDD